MISWPKFSIVTPSYNQGRFLQETIESVLSQDYDALEYIIVDGGSTDESVAIIKSYADQLHFWTSEPDQGQSDALNKGFSHASGDFFVWVNSDDVLLPNALSRVAKYVQNNRNATWISSRRPIWIDQNGHVTRIARLPTFSTAITDLGVMVVGGPSTFFSGELFRESDGFRLDLDYTMDTDLWWQFYSLGTKCHFVDVPLIAFRLHDAAKTSSHHFVQDKVIANHLRSRVRTEDQEIIARYNSSTKASWALILHRMRQILQGNYLKAMLETRRVRGLHWSEVTDSLS